MAEKSDRQTGNSHLPVFLVGGVLIIILIAAASYFFLQYQHTQSMLKDPSKASQNELKALVDKIGKMYRLPTNEAPTLASVTDKGKLPEDVFFKAAENGDKVLLYSENKLAILYRPSINKIISVGPLVIETPVPTAATEDKKEDTSTDEVKVLLLNGTETVGLTKTAEAQLLKLDSLKVTIVDKDNAKKDTYKESVVIDVTGKEKASAEKIANTLGAKVSTLPAGETKPTNASILVILGADYSN